MSNQIEREFDAPKESVRLNKFLSEAGVCSSLYRGKTGEEKHYPFFKLSNEDHLYWKT